MLTKYFSIVRNYVLSVFLHRKHTFYHQNMLFDAFRTNPHNIIGRNLSTVIPLLANQDLTLMLIRSGFSQIFKGSTASKRTEVLSH